MDSPPPPPAPPAEPTLSTLVNPPPGSFHRLSLPFIVRLPLCISAGAFCGFPLGIKKGGQEAGLRFRAEHAHRLPNTQAGWYLYHKSKNYHIALGGIYEGFRMSGRMMPWAAVFVTMEEALDLGRATVVREWRSHRENGPEDLTGDGIVVAAGNKDFVSTTLAGLVTAGLFAAKRDMPLPTAVRLMKLGAKAGLGFGLLQDVLNWFQGRRLGYMEFAKRQILGNPLEGSDAIATVAG